jgi:alpha-amylase
MSSEFKTVDWAAGSNIYEVNVRQYTDEGTFKAFEKELPRLSEMGVEILWFMPVTPISLEKRQGSLGSYYACCDYTSINPEFGSLNDFKKVVNTAHELGMKVIIDWVANHTGYDHQWTIEHPEFYKKNKQGAFYDAFGWVDVIDLDYSNAELRETMIEAMRFWLKECKIDGFRCDMAHLVPLEFWRQARLDLETEKPLFWLAETEEPAYHEVFDATYGWQLLHTMEKMYEQNAGLDNIKSVLEKYHTTFPAGARHAYFTSNHDENSHSGSEYERMGAAAKAFAVLCATLPHAILLVYSGQELPNTKRLLFFDKDRIEWTASPKLHHFYKALLHLRKKYAACFEGDFLAVDTTAPEQVMAYVLTNSVQQVLVILHLNSASRIKFSVLDEAINGLYTNAFLDVNFDLNDKRFEMGAWEYRVYLKG